MHIVINKQNIHLKCTHTDLFLIVTGTNYVRIRLQGKLTELLLLAGHS